MTDFNDKDEEAKKKELKRIRKQQKREREDAKAYEALSDEDKAALLEAGNAIVKHSQNLAAQLIDPKIVESLTKSIMDSHSALISNMVKNFPTHAVQMPPNMLAAIEAATSSQISPLTGISKEITKMMANIYPNGIFPSTALSKQITEMMKNINPEGLSPVRSLKPEDLTSFSPLHQHTPAPIDPTIFTSQGLAEEDKEHIVSILRAVQNGGMTVEEANALLLRLFDK